MDADGEARVVLGWLCSVGVAKGYLLIVYVLLHAFGKYGTFPWCSWLSRQPNMLKVTRSSRVGNSLFFLCFFLLIT